MVTSQNWILQFSGAIIKTYSNPQKPNISEEVLSKINCYHIYKKYVSLLKLILLHKADKQALQSLTSDDWSQSL